MPNFSRVTALKAGTVASLGLFVMLVRSTGAFHDAPAPSDTASARAEDRVQSATVTPTPTPIPSNTPATPAPRTPTPVPVPTTTFRNGSYQAIGTYRTPGGSQSVRITLVIAGDVVVDSSATSLASGNTSEAFQDDFIANYRPLVIGRRLDQLNLTKVSSSSLTPGGFNRAVSSIEGQARL